MKDDRSRSPPIRPDQSRFDREGSAAPQLLVCCEVPPTVGWPRNFARQPRMVLESDLSAVPLHAMARYACNTTPLFDLFTGTRCLSRLCRWLGVGGRRCLQLCCAGAKPSSKLSLDCGRTRRQVPYQPAFFIFSKNLRHRITGFGSEFLQSNHYDFLVVFS